MRTQALHSIYQFRSSDGCRPNKLSLNTSEPLLGRVHCRPIADQTHSTDVWSTLRRHALRRQRRAAAWALQSTPVQQPAEETGKAALEGSLRRDRCWGEHECILQKGPVSSSARAASRSGSRASLGCRATADGRAPGHLEARLPSKTVLHHRCVQSASGMACRQGAKAVPVRLLRPDHAWRVCGRLRVHGPHDARDGPAGLQPRRGLAV